MHRPRPKRVLQGPQFVDQLAEWLLTRCPFTALALLSLLVAGSRVTVSRPYLFVAAVAFADIVVNVFRARRQPRRAARASVMRTNVPV
jgi:hypothetical protein